MGTLYKNIVSLCEERGIKPGRMCNEAGISRGLITDLKMDRKSDITLGTAQKIADYFGVSVDRVLGSDPKEKSPTPEGVGLPFETVLSLLDKLSDDELIDVLAKCTEAMRKKGER